MQAHFNTHIQQEFPEILHKNVLVAVSGGLDSVVLAHLLAQLPIPMALAHCNFSLRQAESDADAVFVEELAAQLKVPFFSITFDTNAYAQKHKMSIQLAARALRYDWFLQLQQKHGYDFLATAHHADDNLETFLMHLSRGSGITGLVGIPKKNKTIIRPLLAFSRDQITDFAVKNNILWREDSSNASVKYTRNKLRHQLIPVLKQMHPEFLDNFKKSITLLQQTKDLATDAIAHQKQKSVTITKDVLSIDIASIVQSANPKAYLYGLLAPYGFTQWDTIYTLLTQSHSGKQVFSTTHGLIRDREVLLLRALTDTTSEQSRYYLQKQDTQITSPITLFQNKIEIIPNISSDMVILDQDTLCYPLLLRKWQAADYFYPSGMQGKKKLSKYFKDEKYNALEKQNQWLLCSKDAVVWVVGKRVDRRFIATQHTKNKIQIALKSF